MLFQRPSDDHLYEALISRTPNFEGLAWVGVTSTQIFCRLTCPAKKPKRENCVFFESVSECLDAGFRPCQRCRPLEALALQEPIVIDLLQQLESDPASIWGEGRLKSQGYDPSTVRRVFKRQFGVTFLEMARLRRLRRGVTTLSQGGDVLTAQLDSGFESGSGFRAAFAKILGCSPSELRRRNGLNASWIPTPLGDMVAVTDDHGLYLLEFFDRKGVATELKKLLAKRGPIGVGRGDVSIQLQKELDDYFSGKGVDFSIPCVQLGSEFTKSVWSLLRQIPIGATVSYGELARQLGRPSASRAVARANGANQIALLIPCHRVIGSDGSLTGYGGGRWRKHWLIEHEQKMSRTN
ncbi:MAG: trifunctional transcriptional activator/DNA repair protein Ada/methylated-DNA--[protein]-cysteine S-methyltransferase [Pseudomonadota bacterium]